jgi:hypothetical protein
MTCCSGKWIPSQRKTILFHLLKNPPLQLSFQNIESSIFDKIGLPSRKPLTNMYTSSEFGLTAGHHLCFGFSRGKYDRENNEEDI